MVSMSPKLLARIILMMASLCLDCNAIKTDAEGINGGLKGLEHAEVQKDNARIGRAGILGMHGFLSGGVSTRPQISLEEMYNSLTMTFVDGVREYRGLREECRNGATGIFIGCRRQLLPMVLEFGYPLTSPRVTPEKFTPEFLAKIPEPDAEGLCCKSAIKFQESLCACDTATIMAMRDLGAFDPEMTVPIAEHIYGKQCGAKTILAEDCPLGSPFDRIRSREID